MPARIQIIGGVSAAPASPVVSGPVAAPSFTPGMNLGLERTAAKMSAGGPVDVSGTFALPFQGITALTFLCLRQVSGGPLTMQVTSSLGTAQAVPFSGLLVVDLPVAPAITAITLMGTGSIEYILAGS